MLSYRLATEVDLPALRSVIDAAMGELLSNFLSPEEVAASHAVMGLDTQLVADGTYFVVEDGSRIAGCAGWSWRATLYGGDHSAGLRDEARLDPARDAARVRAMYTHPDFTRRGVGRMILAHCEGAARQAGFARAELMATLPGEPLYRACGYAVIERLRSVPVNGITVPLVRMGKAI